ncbi:protein of unknown function DUF1332 [Thioalkalivibrio nitratireducens DSM 14787]|uniref:Co-chaperone DjlA N-terminal domain-containing protein n=1 Tax=Thioalkalivibrio nitratireducens (strain DSM 14787 / UNIQEM 213 / ALEN2) TaxID=1255043 RepID=L0DY19_THIND|nr:TerB family tellurite resistance protein [Thioalkalivibrio nitratireducens]AGA33887.1 protein of unknown function DUF1332 [Thioalkalivibrio nitratireducens DSM 14787]
MKDLIDLFRRSLATVQDQIVPSGGPGRSAATQPVTEHDIHLATAALLFEVSRADFQIHDDELVTIREQLASAFDLEPEELGELIHLARLESDELLSLHPFVRVINTHMSPQDKRRIMADLWQVGYADGVLAPRQEAAIRQIADLLYIPHAVFVQTRIEVENARGTRDPDHP